MSVIDLVKWDAIPGVYVWKYPSQELSTWTQLIVNESQEAVLLKGGKLVQVFGSGRHTLSTENFPVLVDIFSLPFGGRSPFTAEVWYINKVVTLDVKWGTTDPIQLMDPKYQVMLPIRGYGQFGVQIDQGVKFLTKLVGTLPQYDEISLTSHFKGIVVSRVKDLIAKKIVNDNISLLEINAWLTEISDYLQQGIEPELAEYGLKLLNFKVMSISAPEDDSSVNKLKDALAKKAEMNIIGYNYQQERSFDTLGAAASNPGAGAGGPMGAGIGLGMGFGIGGAMGRAAGSMASELTVQTAPAPAKSSSCPKCGALVPEGGKFCQSCGAAVAVPPPPSPEGYVCDKCAARSPKGSKFCPNCGDVFNICPNCDADNPEGQAVCIKCGKPLPVKCSACEMMVQGGAKFCPSCGKPLTCGCSKCGELLAPGVKFCPHCGTSQQ